MSLRELDITNSNFPLSAFWHRWNSLASLTMENRRRIDMNQLRDIVVNLQDTLKHLSLAGCQFLFEEPHDEILVFVPLISRLSGTLKYLNINGTNVSLNVVDTLRNIMPECQLSSRVFCTCALTVELEQ